VLSNTPSGIAVFILIYSILTYPSINDYYVLQKFPKKKIQSRPVPLEWLPSQSFPDMCSERATLLPSDKLRIAGIGAGGKGESDLAEFAKSPNVEIVRNG